MKYLLIIGTFLVAVSFVKGVDDRLTQIEYQNTHHYMKVAP